MRKYLILFLISLLVFTGCQTTGRDSSYIDVTGMSVVYMKADEARFTVSAEYVAETTDEARVKTDEIINSAVGILKDKYGVEDEDIETGYLSLSPYYTWNDNVRVLSGQRGMQSINVSISDISMVGNIVEDLSKINGISVGSISLDKADKSAETEEARRLAVDNALDKARTYAEAAGRQIGEVVYISDRLDTGYYNSSNKMMAYASESYPDSMGGTSFYAYDLSVSDTVYLKVEMK